MHPPEFWHRQGFLSRLLAALLAPLGRMYGATVAYRARHSRPYRPRAKVVCVGNLTAGGTGKTPVAIEIARLLAARGVKIVFLTRGYGGRTRGPRFVSTTDNATDVGDEALMLSVVAPALVSSDRAAGAELADEQGFDVIIMDDGHQNFSLCKDLSFVVVDTDVGFGNERMLPAGPLREPVAQGLGRADAIIANGAGACPLSTMLPTIRAKIVPTSSKAWTGQRVFAFAGIGRPERFFATLADLNATVIGTEIYGDHHVYTRSEIARLKARAQNENAVLVTTEKDFVRLSPHDREGIEQLCVRAEFDDRESLACLLDRLVPRQIAPQR